MGLFSEILISQKFYSHFLNYLTAPSSTDFQVEKFAPDGKKEEKV
jgi:hypothetical protein